ncbi:MAG TPA: AIR synthase-related protein, partial [Dehalococcoidia bacterium]|nr:AIR synthase-related protein [Dehalococcoidia bacterium]
NMSPIFHLIQEQGKLSATEMFRTFNMGLGMILVCAREDADKVRQLLPEALAIGHVVRQQGPERIIWED